MSLQKTAPETTSPSTEFDLVMYDYAAEEAVYQRERERRVRDHLGKFAVISGSEFAGVFDTFDEAVMAGRLRFGWGPLVVRPIVEEEEESIYFPHVDVNDPSFRRIDG